MTLTNLRLANFRSYEEKEVEFHPRVTAIIGPNGSGKTNIVEALYVLGMTKGFRDNPAAMARDESEWFRLEAQADKDSFALSWKDGVKKITKNENELSPHEYLGEFPVVLFEPSSLSLVKGSPSLRRQWLDRVLSFSDKAYLRALVQYRKGLKQRNALLRRADASSDEIFAWDIILSEHAEVIATARKKMLDDIEADFSESYSDISKSSDVTTIKYRSSITVDGYREKLLMQLQNRLSMDRRMGGTSVGPHRDDIELIYNGKSLARYGSRGENRTAVLALIMCELGYIQKRLNTPPILLLDDVLSELDEKRQKALLRGIEGVQTVLTSTDIQKDIGAHSTTKL